MSLNDYFIKDSSRVTHYQKYNNPEDAMKASLAHNQAKGKFVDNLSLNYVKHHLLEIMYERQALFLKRCAAAWEDEQPPSYWYWKSQKLQDEEAKYNQFMINCKTNDYVEIEEPPVTPKKSVEYAPVPYDIDPVLEQQCLNDFKEAIRRGRAFYMIQSIKDDQQRQYMAMRYQFLLTAQYHFDLNQYDIKHYYKDLNVTPGKWEKGQTFFPFKKDFFYMIKVD